MEEAGFSVEITELEDLARLRRRVGVPVSAAGCDTGAIDGHVVDGHVPASAIEKLLAEQPPIDGIAVPGMGDDPNAGLDVWTFGVGSTGG